LKNLIVILGPTAVGKTALSIQAAQHFGTEIISADSRQIYHELNIGVARPTQAELEAVKHHLIGHISIHTAYSAGSYERDALSICSQLFEKHDHVICCGGSMMYVDALTKGLDDLPADKSVRENLIRIHQNEGIGALQSQLEQLDPEYYRVVDIHNPHRIIRALEVCLISGQTYTSLRKAAHRERPFRVIAIGMTAQRNWLYSRINKRVDEMMRLGLEEEARMLLPHRHLNSLNTVGYKEMFEYFDGKMSLEMAVEKIKQHTRNFAKRQLTWWRRDPSIHWFAADSKGNGVDFIESVLRSK
jgi:tRNA dimethylallyltransferase